MQVRHADPAACAKYGYARQEVALLTLRDFLSDDEVPVPTRTTRRSRPTCSSRVAFDIVARTAR